ncbi:MAG TPA: hypothetical protein VND64_35985 [Pirellulales bacterium]|nr:hypothetical protein [Pirellulales bacterium]
MKVETMNDEQFDRAVGRAMEQVPIPLGLAERLLATVNSANIVPSADGPLAEGNKLAEGSGLAGGNRLAGERGRVVRRRWLVSASMAAVAALAASVVVYPFLAVPSPMGYDTLINFVGDFHDREPAAEGKPLTEVSPPAAYPFPSSVVTNGLTRWRPVRKLLGRTGVAYDLTGARGRRATLYVVDLTSGSRPIADNCVPTSPHNNGTFTVGRTMGAWTDGTLLYVLVVEGDEGVYRSFLRRQNGLA